MAEKLKLDYAEVSKEEELSSSDVQIDLTTLNPGEEGTVSSHYLSQIVTARYEEIFYFVKQELKAI